jgi:uncharacterized protein YjbJ (UPF0337 family)
MQLARSVLLRSQIYAVFVLARVLLQCPTSQRAAERGSHITSVVRRGAPHGRRSTMNWDQISGQWTQVKGSLREKWGKLTDDDLELVAGNRDKLIGKLQERYGFEKDRALESVDKFIADLKLTPKSNT